MKKARWIVLLVLGIMGVMYLAVAGVMLAVSQSRAGRLLSGMGGSVMPTLILVFGGIGALMLVLGVGLFCFMGRGERKRRELLDVGTIVEGTVVDMKVNYAVKVNRRSPWHVYVSCRHPQTYETVTLRSHNVFDPAVQKGDKVRVAFDPMDERKYAIEVPERNAQA